MRHFSNYDYLIINDDFELAVEELCSVVIAKRVEVNRRADERAEVISALLS